MTLNVLEELDTLLSYLDFTKPLLAL